jgi:hypothetical protein
MEIERTVNIIQPVVEVSSSGSGGCVDGNDADPNEQRRLQGLFRSIADVSASIEALFGG